MYMSQPLQDSFPFLSPRPCSVAYGFIAAQWSNISYRLPCISDSSADDSKDATQSVHLLNVSSWSALGCFLHRLFQPPFVPLPST